jgi:homoprotocatechuate degradation regulator HpaR
MLVVRMRRFDQSLPMALLAARESIMAFFRPHLNELGLTEQQWRVIRVLREHDELEFHELASIAKLLPPSLSGMLTRLERLRLIKRRKRSSDQRRLHIALSPEGVARFDVASRQMERIYRDIEQRFGKRRLASLFSLLHRARALQPDQPAQPTQRRKKREQMR